MPLDIYKRGNRFWVRGRTDGIDGYLERSLKTSNREVAEAQKAEIERKARQRAILGPDAPTEADELTFAAAVLLYDAKPTDAKYLLKIIPELGHKLVKDITPKMVRDLGKKIYPGSACDTWRRQIVSPTCAVINNAHQEKGTPLIRVKSFTRAERQKQDDLRGKQSRAQRTLGSWHWLAEFREHANRYLGALAFFMFTTGARITQAIVMEPRHLDLQNHRVLIPAAKGHEEQWASIMTELVVELANLPPRNGRVFGYQQRWGVYKSWKSACERAGIEYIPPHSAGRHGFGTELVVRQGVDPRTAADMGRWSSPKILLDTYTHAENETTCVHEAFRRGKPEKFSANVQVHAGRKRK